MAEMRVLAWALCNDHQAIATCVMPQCCRHRPRLRCYFRSYVRSQCLNMFWQLPVKYKKPKIRATATPKIFRQHVTNFECIEISKSKW